MGGKVVMVIMNWDSGVNEEWLVVMILSVKYEVENVMEMYIYEGIIEWFECFGDWEMMFYKRGFVFII